MRLIRKRKKEPMKERKHEERRNCSSKRKGNI